MHFEKGIVCILQRIKGRCFCKKWEEEESGIFKSLNAQKSRMYNGEFLVSQSPKSTHVLAHLRHYKILICRGVILSLLLLFF